MVKILKDIQPSFIDYPDNSSISLCVVMMGCVNGCKGCHNPLFQNHDLVADYLKEVSVDELYKELKDLCYRNKTNKVVLSGGDPLSPRNISFTKELLQKCNDIDICIYTGHDIDYVKENGVSGFKFIKCGKFNIDDKRESNKDDEKIIFASSNQKLYNDKYELISNDGIYKFN